MPRPNSSVVHPGLYDHLGAAGLWPHEAAVERRTTSQTGTGAVTEAFSLVRRVRGRMAAVDTMQHGEVRRSDGTIVVGSHEFDCDGSYDVREDDRVVVDDLAYDVTAVLRASSDGRTLLRLERVT